MSEIVVAHSRNIPAYPSRKGWKPRTAADFGDGGAYPEIHLAQYPLDMGRNANQSGSSSNNKTLALQVDAEGRVRYESLLDPTGQRKIQATHSAMVPMKGVREQDLQRPSEEELMETTEKTKLALGLVMQKKQTGPAARGPTESEYINYTPAYSSSSVSQTRIIKMAQVQVDPLEPAKHKLKKAPPPPPEPPVPVLHSPPRKLTAEDQAEWNIPPCISNWKNNKGYTIPLDKRLSADGRNLREVQLGDNHPRVAESLYLAEQLAREELAERQKMEQLQRLKEREKHEEAIRREAEQSRLQRTAAAVGREFDSRDSSSSSERQERDEIREQRRRELERDLRLQRNRSAASRNGERDISERIALGQAVPTQRSGEALFDARLFNQGSGLGARQAGEDEYAVYSKPLFSATSTSQLYRPRKQSGDDNEEDPDAAEQKVAKLRSETSKFAPARGFSGTETTTGNSKKGGAAPPVRDGPIAFQQEQKGDDFGFDEFMSSGHTKKTLDIGRSSQMSVGAASSGSEQFSGSKRSAGDSSSSAADLKRRFK